ncbi:hypothetical protein CC86DRAFT_456327 [Ophiobolus disseminans]|uniref:Uncharacterized protein n=1 Tax=Ophiobolus disseminans TaxID=1469910 RepID=A0A6A7A003_9PLEO|nr:hypothetical protein CC86DRAFT_456327 [Ophiobolus disseminans]
MANTRKTSPAAKRRKINTTLGLNVTLRARNGGDDTCFLPAGLPFTTDDGSSTEEEDNTELEDHYLNKMTDDTDQPRETVFGPGVEVWKSHGGTIYADLDDKTKRQLREKEIWTEEAKAKVSVGSKRKVSDMARSFGGEGEMKKKEAKGKGNGKAKPPKPVKIAPYPARTPTDTMFNHGSAAIDSQGAHSRPIKPLPKRTSTLTPTSVLAGPGRVGMEASPSPPPKWAYRDATPAAGESFESGDGST